MTCSGVQLIGTSTTREGQGQGAYGNITRGNWRAAFAILIMWRLNKFENGKFIDKEK